MNIKVHDPHEGLTPSGIIKTGANLSRMAPEFCPVLNEVVNRVVGRGPEVSLYLYGSVATGTARVGQSEVDLLAIGLDVQAARELGAELSKKFADLCRGVEIGPGRRAGYEGSNDESYGNQVFLRHYCVHLTGPDFRNEFPDYPGDSAAARGFNGDIGILVGKWRDQLERAENLVSLARKVAGKTLFAVTGLVSIHDGTWTTDRAAARKRWEQVKPELSADLKTLSVWHRSQSMTLSRDEIQNMLEGTIVKVVDDFSALIGLWND